MEHGQPEDGKPPQADIGGQNPETNAKISVVAENAPEKGAWPMADS